MSEKRLEYRKHRDIEIRSELGPDSYAFFSKFDRTQMKRVLSNLLNNAIEALDGKGTVLVKASGSLEQICITVEDNGKGIPEDKMPLLMKEGISFGKKNGMGRGLYHSKLMTESWGGRIHIESKLGQGTKVTILLPRVTAPGWFVPEIVVSPETKIVILDDDNSIHYVWKKIFAPFTERLVDQPVHLYSATEFEDWRAKSAPGPEHLYLIDYELLKEKVTGLDIIRTHHLENQSILVTSRFEEKEVAEAADGLNLRIIPKEMARFVPVSFSDSADTYVLLDDDPVTCEAWKDSAEDYGVALTTFSSPVQLLSSLSEMKRATYFCIDQDLGRGEISGLEVAKEIYEAGYRNILLATAHRRRDIPDLPWWIRGTIGKAPPWKQNGAVIRAVQ